MRVPSGRPVSRQCCVVPAVSPAPLDTSRPRLTLRRIELASTAGVALASSLRRARIVYSRELVPAAGGESKAPRTSPKEPATVERAAITTASGGVPTTSIVIGVPGSKPLPNTANEPPE